MKRLSQKSKEHKELRKRKIFNAAIKLFSKQGYYKTTLEQIAKQARIAKATIYLYAKNKKHLLYFLIEEGANMYLQQIKDTINFNDDALTKLKKIIRLHLEMIFKYRDVYRVLTSEVVWLDKILKKGIKDKREEFINLFEKIIREGKKENLINKNIDTKLAYYFFLGMCDIFARSWVDIDESYKLDKIVDNAVNIYSNGIVNKKEV